MTESSKLVSWRIGMLNHEIASDERLPDSSKWLDEWRMPLLPRKSVDRDRILEMLQKINEYLTVEVGGSQPLAWANSYMGRTLIGLIGELEGVRDGEWSKVLSPDKSRRGNRRRAPLLARLMIKAECVFAVDFFTPAFGSPRKAKDAISEVAKGLGSTCSRSSLDNWKRELKETNNELGFLRSRFFELLPEDLKVSSNIKPSDQERLKGCLRGVLRPWVGDVRTTELTTKSARDSGQ